MWPKNNENATIMTLSNLLIIPWQGWQDLNPRHPVLETGALPTELHPYAVITGLLYLKSLLLVEVKVGACHARWQASGKTTAWRFGLSVFGQAVGSRTGSRHL
jgi:hypothetical protein